VSLLMDALNKAEQAKRQNQADAADASAAPPAAPSSLKLELTPLMASDDTPPPAAAPPALPQLPTHLGVLDEEFIAHAATSKQPAKDKKPAQPGPAEAPPAPVAPAPAASKAAAPPAPQKADAEDRQAAQNLFDAKQARPPIGNKRLALALGLLTLLAAGAIGVYFWLQLQPSGSLTMASLSASVRPPLPPPQPAAPATPLAAPAPLAASAPPPASAVPPPAREPVRPAAVAAPERAEPPSPIRVSTARITLNPSLANGYEAYMAGNFDLAKNEYLQVLNGEPSNLDALHGMAAISLRQRQSAAAEEYYRRALEADPKDALAQAGLIGLKGQGDPFQAETRLNSLLAAQPDLPAINFALGTLYASQNRWNEAQAAYFRAYRSEPDNPDTLFNLAVSLDHLNQSKLALQYYNLALAAAANRPASFNRAQIDARLRELQP